MKAALAMAAGCVVVLAGWIALAGPASGRDVGLGLLGPLLAVATTSVWLERAMARDPASVTGVLLQGFAGKVVFFGIYVVAMIKIAHVERVPFVVSFTGCFVTLYWVQAILLQRLLRDARAEAPGPQ